MKILNVSFLAAALLLLSCGSEINQAKYQDADQQNDLVQVSGRDIPKTIILVTNESTNEIKAYEVEANLNLEGLSAAEKFKATADSRGKEISTKSVDSGFSVNVKDFDLPQKNAVNWFRFGYRGFYGYGYGYRFPYGYGFGYRYGGYRFSYYRPYYGYGYGYRYRNNYYW